MSTVRVLNPMLNDICKLGTGGSTANLIMTTTTITPPRNQQMKRVKRDLFGAANPIETKKLFNDELVKYQELASKKWDFDFREGKPLNSCNNTKYIWERVSTYEKIFAPDMYTLTRAAHARPLPADMTDNDLLLDERAGRENAINDVDSCDDECIEDNDFMLFKVPTIVPKLAVTTNSKKPAAIVNIQPMRNKRQPKITEYMKERKRLAPTPQKSTAIKRMRSSTTTAGIRPKTVATAMAATTTYSSSNIPYNLHVHFPTRSRHK